MILGRLLGTWLVSKEPSVRAVVRFLSCASLATDSRSHVLLDGPTRYAMAI